MRDWNDTHFIFGWMEAFTYLDEDPQDADRLLIAFGAEKEKVDQCRRLHDHAHGFDEIREKREAYWRKRFEREYGIEAKEDAYTHSFSQPKCEILDFTKNKPDKPKKGKGNAGRKAE